MKVHPSLCGRRPAGPAVPPHVDGVVPAAPRRDRWRRGRDDGAAERRGGAPRARQRQELPAAQGPSDRLDILSSKGNFCDGFSVKSEKGQSVCSTSLFQAVEYQHECIVKLILEHSKSNSVLESRDFEQFTPLLLSACYTNANITKLLLKAGADINAVEYRDKNVFHLASEFDRTECLRVSFVT